MKVFGLGCSLLILPALNRELEYLPPPPPPPDENLNLGTVVEKGEHPNFRVSISGGMQRWPEDGSGARSSPDPLPRGLGFRV